MMAYMPGFSYTDEPNLAHLLPGLAARFGVGDPVAGLDGLPVCQRFVLVMVDGLGWELLRRSLMDAPYLSELAGDALRLSTGLPSTTATSLLSLWTGLPPGGHGVVGYSYAAPAAPGSPGRLTLPLSAAGPLTAAPSMMDRLVRAGVAVSWVVPGEHLGTGLTRAGAERAQLVAADPARSGERVAAITEAVRRSDRSLVYVYERRLDHTGHRHGVASEQWRHALSAVDDFLDRLRLNLPSDTCLLVTGDHGMVDVPAEDRVDIDADPELSRDLRLIGGEARFRHLYSATPRAVAARWRDRLGESATVLTRDEAVEAGLFGPVDPDYRERIGDVVVLAQGLQAFLTAAFPLERRLVGMHGSNTAAERFVPLLTDLVA